MSKKRKFLMGLSAAVAVVAAGASTSFAKKSYEQKTGTTYETTNTLISDLLMEEQSFSNESIQVVGHSSHASHASHGSHASHSSHSSGM